MSKKIKVFKSDILSLLENLPPKMRIALKGDAIVNLTSDQIINEFDKKSKLGKQYYIQIAKAVRQKKEDKTWSTKNNLGVVLS